MKQGDFEIELIDHVDQRVFKEHYKGESNEMFAEVEPDREFSIRLTSDCSETVSVTIKVDDEILVERRRLLPWSTTTEGVWESDKDVKGGRSSGRSMRALLVGRALADGTKEGPFKFWTGEVEANFYGNPLYKMPPLQPPPPTSATSSPSLSDISDYSTPPPSRPSTSSDRDVRVEPIYDLGKCRIHPRNKNEISKDVGYVAGKMEKKLKKGVKAEKGTSLLCSIPPKKRKKAPRMRAQHTRPSGKPFASKPKKGPSRPVVEAEHLGTLKLKYCTAEGLIFAGVLPKPANWEVEQVRKQEMHENKNRTDNWKALSEAKVQYIDDGYRDANGNFQSTGKRKELFDLTNQTDDDSVP